VRILLTSDQHYRLPVLDWLCEVADQYDAVVLAGDILNVAAIVPLPAQVVVADLYLKRLAQRCPVFVVSGNHDLDGPGEHGEQVSGWLRRSQSTDLHVDGQSVDVDNIRFTLCPWWDGPVSRDAVAEQLDAASVNRPDWWIWVYHSPPAGTPLCVDNHRTFADEDLARWITRYQPDLVLCGHIHGAPWADNGGWNARLGHTWVFNAGHLNVKVPPHIVLDTEMRTAVWQGLTGDDQQTVVLDARPA
jgi:Icc-related predicted phosphoesterase